MLHQTTLPFRYLPTRGYFVQRTRFREGSGCAALLFIALGLLTLVVFLIVLNNRPGIGDVRLAEQKIQVGMTKDEVQLLLGRPHGQSEGGQRGAEWDYRELGGLLPGSILRVYFGPDDRVTARESWCQ